MGGSVIHFLLERNYYRINMRVLLFSSLVALAYGSTGNSSATYIRIDMYGSGVDATGNAPGSCPGAITRSFLVKPVKAGHDLTKNATHPTQWTTSMDRHGSCVNFVLSTNDPVMFPGSAFDKSFALFDGGSGIYNSVSFATADCYGAGQVQASGFNFSPNATGSTDCSGVTATVNDAGGLIIVNGAQVIEAKGTLFLNSRALQGQLNGPFNDSSCTALSANNAASFPITIPLTDTVATDTAFNEYAISNTGFCTSHGTASAVHIIRHKTSTTKGELIFEISSGGSVAFASRASCTDGSTYSKITFTANLNGGFPHCVQAVDNSGTVQSNKFYTFNPSGESIGEWPTFPDGPACPASGTTACTSPATTLRLSATMAVLVALIGMMM